MLRVQTKLSVAVALLLGFVASASARVNVPDWARQAAVTQVGPFPPEVRAVWLLNDTEYRVTGAGEYVEHTRQVLKILRPEGREDGNPGVEYRKDERVLSLHAWSLDTAGNEFELKDKDFVERGLFSFELYSDYMARTAHAPALQPGTVIALEYEIKRREWINEIGWQFQSEFPTAETVLTVELPPGWEYRTAWSSGTPNEPRQTGQNRWEWRLKNIPGVASDLEPMMPSPRALAARMSLAYFAPGQKTANSATWQQVGNWYLGLVGDRASPNPEITAKVQQLTAGKNDFDAKLQALTRFLQSEIRYVAVEIGVGGDQPHIAGDVLHYRYGDCKDKVTLLKSMLQVAGIHSYYVLVDTRRGFVNPAVPSSWGNHAIIAVQLPDDVKTDAYESVVTLKSGKHYIVFDPTDEYTPVGSLRATLQNSYALVVTDTGGELVHTPVLPPDTNLATRTGHFTLTPDGALSGAVSLQLGGDFASRDRQVLHEADQRKREHLITDSVGQAISGFSLDKLDFEQTDQVDKPLTINYQITAPLYGQARGPLMLVRPRVLGTQSHSVEHKARQYPLDLRRTAREIDTYDIQIPDGYVVEDFPSPVKLDVGFASYESRVNIEGSKLRYWRQYTVRELSVPAEKYADWVKLQGTIGADEAAVAVLKRQP